MCPCSILWAESGLVLSCPSLWKHYRFINNWSFTNQIGKLPKTPDARLCLGFSIWLFGDKIFILDRINCRLYASEYRYIDTFCISLRKKKLLFDSLWIVLNQMTEKLLWHILQSWVSLLPPSQSEMQRMNQMSVWLN